MIELINIADDGSLSINRLELRGVAPYDKIIKRIRKLPNDKAGHKKILNLKELFYIRQMGDAMLNRNIYAAFGEKERHTKICADTQMPSDWIRDDLVRWGIKKYVEIQNDYVPSAAMLNSLEQGLMLQARGVKAMNETIELLIEKIEKAKVLLDDPNLTEEDLKKHESSITTLSETLYKSMERNQKITKSTPESLKAIEDLKRIVRAEESKSKEITGGKRKGNREDPKKK
ncbi:MAG: hypothetical protein COA82_03610 [Alkaliphilus sp.]|nr:MAG: hypothetical protein COA82_03610 [Alkaliphilus sp.]